MTDQIDIRNRRKLARHCLAGLSVGDAFGQQFVSQPELVARREQPMYPWTFTDDTVMGIAVTQCLEINGQIDPDDLAQRFAAAFAEDPYRGYGDTAQGILRSISDGTDWKTAASAVFRGAGSMGNGAAMRVGPIGAWFYDDLDRVAEQAQMSAQVTHMHIEGQAGAIAVAVAAAKACDWFLNGVPANGRQELIKAVLPFVPPSQTAEGLMAACSVGSRVSPRDAAAELGNGSQITSQDTVPFCLWAAEAYLSSYQDALWQTATAFGDLDTNCAIVGSIVALANGPNCIPEDWLLSRESLNG